MYTQEKLKEVLFQEFAAHPRKLSEVFECVKAMQRDKVVFDGFYYIHRNTHNGDAGVSKLWEHS